MNLNLKYLNDAETFVSEFEAESEPDRLRQAYLALENVSLAREVIPASRTLLRAKCLSLWLRILGIIDGLRDPKFDPEDTPDNLVQPPPTSGGIVYTPGADPALIDDPKARAQYEKEIAANQAAQVRYRLQFHLDRLNQRIPPRAEAFVRQAYTSAHGDREELRAAIDATVKSPERKARLLTLLGGN